MGLKGLLTSVGMNPFGLTALVLSFTAFVAVVLWTLTRPKREIEAQSRLWEEEDDHV